MSELFPASLGNAFSTLRAFGGFPPEATEFETSKVVILPVPYDSTTTYRCGAREGPQAIIDASQYLETYDLELDQETYRVGIHTLPELEPCMGGPEEMIQRVYEVTGELVGRGKLVVMLGGEHSLTLGVVRAFKERYDGLSLLQLDAHADLRNEYLGTRYSHACIGRRLWELCPLVQVGIRSLSLTERRFIHEKGLRPFYQGEIASQGSFTDEVISLLSEEVYITLDLDVLDLSIMSAVGTPEPGGMGWGEVLALLRAIAGRKRVVGFDLVELCPREGPTSCAFLAAKLAYKLIGYATFGERAGL